MIGNKAFDIVAFSNNYFDKDFVYEIKYIYKNITTNDIRQYQDNMRKLRKTFSEETNHLPYMVLTLITQDSLYEYTKEIVQEVKKQNNYSIEVIKESQL